MHAVYEITKSLLEYLQNYSESLIQAEKGASTVSILASKLGIVGFDFSYFTTDFGK